MKVLCVYATRQIDSNLMMASTVFRGLYEAGHTADMVFMGSSDAIDEFKRRYERYFRKVFYNCICNPLKENAAYRKKPLLYTYIRSFILDSLYTPETNWIKAIDKTHYNRILSFIPPVISGQYAIKIKKTFFSDVPLIQFWSDPLSLGRCNSLSDIPKSRFLHKYIEARLLKAKYVDKIVFCYPLLCQMEAKLHPESAHKMTWSDVSYLPHSNNPKLRQHTRPLIGLFGAYPTHVRNITPLLDAIKKLPDYDFIIRGDGDLPYPVDNIPNLDLKPGRISLSEVETLENECDILLSLGGKSGITHPAGKTFYYADYNKPIIHIGDGQHAKFFKEYIDGFDERFHHCFNHSDEIQSAINNAVKQLHTFNLYIPNRMNAAVIAKRILEI